MATKAGATSKKKAATKKEQSAKSKAKEAVKATEEEGVEVDTSQADAESVGNLSEFEQRRAEAEATEAAGLKIMSGPAAVDGRAISAAIVRVEHFGHPCNPYFGVSPARERAEGGDPTCPTCAMPLTGGNSRQTPLGNYKPETGDLYKVGDEFRTVTASMTSWDAVPDLLPKKAEAA